jgi:uncharacterized protein YodC (DUF2158 family)
MSKIAIYAAVLCVLAVGSLHSTLAETGATASQGRVVGGPTFNPGDLVRLRSGGPLMTVDEVLGDKVVAYWSTEYGDVRSATFPISELDEPLTLPPADPNLKKEEAAVDRYYKKRCPTGFVDIATGKFQCAY